jgi:hypothetical protein
VDETKRDNIKESSQLNFKETGPEEIIMNVLCWYYLEIVIWNFYYRSCGPRYNIQLQTKYLQFLINEECLNKYIISFYLIESFYLTYILYPWYKKIKRYECKKIWFLTNNLQRKNNFLQFLYKIWSTSYSRRWFLQMIFKVKDRKKRKFLAVKFTNNLFSSKQLRWLRITLIFDFHILWGHDLIDKWNLIVITDKIINLGFLMYI